MIKKRILKASMCFVLCLAVLFQSYMPVAAYSVNSYSQDSLSYEDSSLTCGIDNFLNCIFPILSELTLSDIVKSNVYSDKTMSSLLIDFYKSIEADSSSLYILGIDISPKALSYALSDYPDVSNAIRDCLSWEDVDLSNSKWGISDKESFLTALSASFSPFNDFLYTLLCSGDFNVSIINFKGSDGYENSIVPILLSLKCENLLSQEDFSMMAVNDKSTMLFNIMYPLFTLLENASENPMDELTYILPSFAYFYESGEFENCINQLFSPITSNRLISIAIKLNLLDFSTQDLSLNSLANNNYNSIQIADINFQSLANCGYHNGFEFISDKEAACPVILHWIIDTVKLNESMLLNLQNNQSDVLAPDDILSSVLTTDTSILVDVIISLFSPTILDSPQNVSYPDLQSASAQYATTLTEEDYGKILREMDDLLDDFVRDDGTYKNTEAMFSSALYTNANITNLVIGVYRALEENNLTDFFQFVNIDISPSGVAKYLHEFKFLPAKTILNKVESWADISSGDINWGFYDGSKSGFQSALIASLRPLEPILRTLLAGEDLVIANSIILKGAEGYNTSIIPILEAIGCNQDLIKTYPQFLNSSNFDNLLRCITDPVLDLFDNIANHPVETITRILPNVIYFINSGAFEVCLSNLFIPITSFINKLSPIYNFNINENLFKNNIDIGNIVITFLENSGLKVADFDINVFGNFGTKIECASKRIVDGSPVQYSYIQANQIDVLAEFLMIFAKTLKMPENKNVLTNLMGESSNSFASYSSYVEEQLEIMNEDQLLEWLYNLLFKERAHTEIAVDDNYSPTIIYKEKETNYVWLYIAGAYLSAVAIVGLIIFLNRKRLYY